MSSRAEQPFANLKFDIRSPDLSLLVPGLKGHVNGSGQINGDWHDPAIQATVNAGALEYRRVTLVDSGLPGDASGLATPASGGVTGARPTFALDSPRSQTPVWERTVRRNPVSTPRQRGRTSVAQASPFIGVTTPFEQRYEFHVRLKLNR